MNILSIVWSMSTAAIMVDGEIKGCISEERFSRIKNDDSYPKNSIESVLKMAGIEAEALDLVVIAGKRFDPVGVLCHKYSKFTVSDRLREQRDYWYPRLIQGKTISFLDVFKDKLDIKQYPGNWSEVIKFLEEQDQQNSDEFFMTFRRTVICDHLGVHPSKVVFASHHQAHAYYAFYGSSMIKDKTVILTADAWGDDNNASVSLADNGDIRLLNSSTNFIIGRLYRYITLLLGMKPDEHEYKVMGLAAYAKPQYYQEALNIFKNTMFVDGLGFNYNETPSDLYFYFRNKLEGQRFDNIAGAIQKYTEDILIDWARNSLEATGAQRLCFGGGVGMNIKAMMEIARLPKLKEILIVPSPSDESLAIGAAYVVMHDICKQNGQNPIDVLKPLKNAYLGPQASPEEVIATVEQARCKGYKTNSEVDIKYIAKLLSEGKVLGRCVGRSEFGARALGNRSIIGDPRRLGIIKIINEKVKNRDFWMPFAASILEDQADRYLVNPKGLKAPYMTLGFDTKPAAWEDLIAGLHQADLTARPQIVSKEANADYYELINEFYLLTGVGGILNTSFNVHGEPIIQTPAEALDVFERGNLDGLILDGFFIERT